LRIYDVIWKNAFVEKLYAKHDITTDEVEEVLFTKPHIRFAEKGHIGGEHLYSAYGRTDAGRHLIVFFIRKRSAAALPISARDMNRVERKYYDAQKKD